MKIAYIILCHKNSEQVSLLVNKLNSANNDFYVHVDKKVESFDLPNLKNVYVLPKEKKVSVQWATKSMIIATLNTIDFLLKSKKEYDYIFLISGQDFPLKSNDEIVSFLNNNNDKNFIEVLSHNNPLYRRYSKRNAIFYPKWMLSRNFFTKLLKKLYIYITGGYGYTFGVFKRKNTTGLNFEFGSQWWCLKYQCVKWIYEYIKSNKSILSFFDYALVPDECIFQTVFMASPFKNTRQDNLTYLEWGKNNNNPKILTIEDYYTIKNSDKLLARKFDINIDRKILEKLQEGIEKN